MLEFNKVLLAGNLTRDPELKYLPSGMAIADLRLAINRRIFDRNSGERREETLFIDVTAWDKTAEFCKNYLHKGSGIFVEGRLKQDSWEDKQTGQARSKIAVVAERIQFAESKGQGSGESYGGESDPGEAGPGMNRRNAAPERPAAPARNMNQAPSEPGSTEDDLPF